MKRETYNKYFADAERITIGLPAILVKENDTYFITTTDEGEDILGQSPYGQGKTREEAEEEFWKMVKFMIEYHEKRSRALNLWKPFQKGDWSHIGGSWFTIFGINVYFRYGKGMQGGWYIPWTKMNISVNNYWSVYKKTKKDVTK